MSSAAQHNLKLISTQFRLRNLKKIEGVNITVNCESNGIGSIYYTLHHYRDDEAFYTSETLPQHLQQKWAEINCPEIMKSNKNCICVKVWLKVAASVESQKKNRNTNAEKGIRETTANMQYSAADKLLFCWGVYFSGLTMLHQSNDIKFGENTLIFQLNDVEFSSSDYIFSGNAKDQSISMYQRGTNTEKLTISSSTDSFKSNSPNMSGNSSPNSIITDERVLQIYCHRNELRRSYDLNKLLRIQEIQRQRLRTLRESDDIVADIKQLCLYCITPEQPKRRVRTSSSSYSSSKYNQHYQQYHSMGRKLSKLLAEEIHIEPAELLQAQKLLKELESLRFRNGLLVTEQTTLKDRVADLKNQLSTIRNERIRLKENLELQVSNLEKEKILLEEQHIERKNLIQKKQCIVQSLEKRRSTLIAELQEIYSIKWNEHGLYTICDIPCSSLSPVAHGSNNTALEQQISPLAVRASLGYIAHLVKMISIIIDQPLRSPLTIDETWLHYYTPKVSRSSNS